MLQRSRGGHKHHKSRKLNQAQTVLSATSDRTTYSSVLMKFKCHLPMRSSLCAVYASHNLRKPTMPILSESLSGLDFGLQPTTFWTQQFVSTTLSDGEEGNVSGVIYLMLNWLHEKTETVLWKEAYEREGKSWRKRGSEC
jgi:hypothetical protein